jgi:uncharacterized phage protein (TIGR02218 family)
MGITDGELTSVALCWTAERADGAGIALTSHDRAVVREATLHEPAPGLTPAKVSRIGGLTAEDAELTGALDGDGLTEADLAVGRWDGAKVTLSAVDWQRPDGPAINLLQGSLGEVSQEGGRFTAELTGVAALLSRPVCPYTSPECRVELGDKSCRVDLAGRTARVRVVAQDGGQITIEPPADERFLFGRLRYLTGANCGARTTVLEVSGNMLRARDRPRVEIEPGCVLELVEGCDKRLDTCVQRFANAVNFRGEPHLPGTDLLTRYPGN